jgi:hypothetical protein
LCEGTTSHKLCERDKGKFKQGENALLRELFKGTVALFQLKEQTSKAKRACANNLLEFFLQKGCESKLKV